MALELIRPNPAGPPAQEPIQSSSLRTEDLDEQGRRLHRVVSAHVRSALRFNRAARQKNFTPLLGSEY